ncbi:hypothetical protein [Mesorhizobium sp. M0520]|uniref:hypothetical protein n=1 Tax=Mesorhizobium sp. M0520 TaxID=2956957 RepID=UPI00333A951C
MLTFKPRGQIQSWAFEVELGRLSALVSDMEQVGLGSPVEDLVDHAPRLDSWLVGRRSIPCLVGLSTGHPTLTGGDRPIATSDLWLMSTDGIGLAPCHAGIDLAVRMAARTVTHEARDGPVLSTSGAYMTVEENPADKAAASDVLRTLALKGKGLTGADIERLVREARHTARREQRPLVYFDLFDILAYCNPERPHALRWRMAVHESGHTIAYLNLGIGTITAITIDTPGGGYIEAEIPNPSEETEELAGAMLVMRLAGRAAEYEILGSVTAGSGGSSTSDLATATASGRRLGAPDRRWWRRRKSIRKGGGMTSSRLKFLGRDKDRHGNDRYHVRRPGHRKIRLREQFEDENGFITEEFMAGYRLALDRKEVKKKEFVKKVEVSFNWLVASTTSLQSFRRWIHIHKGTKKEY